MCISYTLIQDSENLKMKMIIIRMIMMMIMMMTTTTAIMVKRTEKFFSKLKLGIFYRIAVFFFVLVFILCRFLQLHASSYGYSCYRSYMNCGFTNMQGPVKYKCIAGLCLALSFTVRCLMMPLIDVL